MQIQSFHPKENVVVMKRMFQLTVGAPLVIAIAACERAPSSRTNEAASAQSKPGNLKSVASTVLKDSTAASDKLSNSQKCSFPSGGNISYQKSESAAGGHLKLSLTEPLKGCEHLGKSLYAFAKHFEEAPVISSQRFDTGFLRVTKSTHCFTDLNLKNRSAVKENWFFYVDSASESTPVGHIRAVSANSDDDLSCYFNVSDVAIEPFEISDVNQIVSGCEKDPTLSLDLPQPFASIHGRLRFGKEFHLFQEASYQITDEKTGAGIVVLSSNDKQRSAKMVSLGAIGRKSSGTSIPLVKVKITIGDGPTARVIEDVCAGDYLVDRE